jgi:hypothetical protein
MSWPRSVDDEHATRGGESERIDRQRGRMGGLTRRRPPRAGLRPTVRFAIALLLTLAWVAFGVWVSERGATSLGWPPGPCLRG